MCTTTHTNYFGLFADFWAFRPSMDYMLPQIPRKTADDFGKGSEMHAERVIMGSADRTYGPRELHAFWKEIYERPSLSDDAREAFRISLAWRLTREVAERSGHIKGEEPLETIAVEWQSVTTGTKPNHTDIPMEEWALVGLLNREPGIRLHPKGSSPDELARFEHAMELMAIELNLIDGCSGIPDLGRLGMPGLIELWPSQEKILQHEANLIEAVQAQVEHKGQTRVAEYIVSVTGLRLNAARRFGRVAMWQLRSDTAMDQELARAMMLAQLENVIFRSQQDNDKQAELRAQMMSINLRGLLKNVDDNTLDEMQKIMKKLGDEDEEEAEARDAAYDEEHPPEAGA